MRASALLRLPLVLLALAAAACSPRLLPGTEIKDDPDTRAIFELIRAYRDAMRQRDAAAILAMVSPDYFDNSGTPEPEDDVDRAILEKRLPQDLEKVDAMNLDLTLRNIQVQNDRAVAEVFYDSWYRVKTPAGDVARRDSDIHQFRLRKLGGKWLFAGGL
ncbi:nuclear transport factor 2 family protein [Anaeromyxobacter oryzae]|uniref:DUF4440 domain-containing protein n=1 Tax=Anaeromyxobacter oryzae TaxID=2918170 RepID=A0ABM7WZF2_9BACT|nr:nuclear transport factor 2 family protein [Anaeromyxobacter oryzae]BDG04922.1 hypothetical protein AMOR_39180 [Anaeromyxobacter oryzae]